MKYIRTKNNVYRNASADKDIVIICKKRKLITNPKGIFNQANTIEELCDEFVFIKGNIKLIFSPITYNKEKDIKFFDEIYGAIWTNIGLIYVAKMNNEGELELL